MSRADEIKARANALRTQDRQPRVATERARPVRRTVDLSPARHAKLTEWCGQTAQELGVARVTGQQVISALVGRLLTDMTLMAKIKADINESIKRR
jgi:hypothetical protein